MRARKATVAAPSNIAFVKYWGARDVERGIPSNRSISMTLSRCESICTVEFRAGEAAVPGDEVLIASERGSLDPAPRGFASPVLAHLERVRSWAGVTGPFRVATRNTFPSAAGLASSASGFAALSLAAARAAGRQPTPVELSDLARRSGSGSAARSAFGGYVEWPARDPGRDPVGAGGVPVPDEADGAGSGAEPSFPAMRLASHEHWDLRDLIAIVEASPKEVSSREGHRRVLTSPYFETRLGLLPTRLAEVRAAIHERDFDRLRPVLEAEAVDLHFLAMSARPPFHYWTPGTVEVVEAVRSLRAAGVPAAWTMDAGPNVHVICPPEAETEVAGRLESLTSVRTLIEDRVGPGPRTDPEPLF